MKKRTLALVALIAATAFAAGVVTNAIVEKPLSGEEVAQVKSQLQYLADVQSMYMMVLPEAADRFAEKRDAFLHAKALLEEAQANHVEDVAPSGRRLRAMDR